VPALDGRRHARSRDPVPGGSSATPTSPGSPSPSKQTSPHNAPRTPLTPRPRTPTSPPRSSTATGTTSVSVLRTESGSCRLRSANPENAEGPPKRAFRCYVYCPAGASCPSGCTSWSPGRSAPGRTAPRP
jgi:hypothetical protein